MEVKFKQVAPEELAQMESSRKGRVSYPIIKGFMETGFQIAEVEVPPNRKSQNLQILLKSFINSHDYPIKVVRKRTKIFLVRLDIDEEGNKIPNWKEIHYPMENLESPVEDAPPVDDALE